MDDNVQTVDVPVNQGTEPKEEPKPAATTQAEPSVEDRIKKAVDEAVAKATTEVQKRLQSETDKAIAKYKRETAIERQVREQAEAKLAELDPDASKDLKIAYYQAKENTDGGKTPEETAEERGVAFDKQFREAVEVLTEAEIDTKTLDWADDVAIAGKGDYVEKLKRLNKQVAKLIKANIEKAKKEAKEQYDKKLKEAGIDSVDTSNAPAAGSQSDSAFIKRFNTGELPATPENMKRVQKIIDSLK